MVVVEIELRSGGNILNGRNKRKGLDCECGDSFPLMLSDNVFKTGSYRRI